MNITVDSETVVLEQMSFESQDIFISRIVFFLKALDLGLEKQKAITLSYVYRNKLLYNVSYTTDIEKRIQEIVSII
jgi:hypothetical protein